MGERRWFHRRGMGRLLRRGPVLRMVADGCPDAAPEYLTAVVELLEQHGTLLDRWWRAGAGRRQLELNWQVWGSEHHVQVLESGHEVRCVLRRSPELIGTAPSPTAEARQDVALALDAVTERLGIASFALR